MRLRWFPTPPREQSATANSRCRLLSSPAAGEYDHSRRLVGPDEGCGPCRGIAATISARSSREAAPRPQSRRSANSPLRYATLARIADRSAHDSPTRSNSNQFNRMASRIPSASERNTGAAAQGRRSVPSLERRRSRNDATLQTRSEGVARPRSWVPFRCHLCRAIGALDVGETQRLFEPAGRRMYC